MALIDEVQLELKAGDGGDGVVRWRKEKFKPKMGPGGGNGGRGGNVVALAVTELDYLEFYRHKKKFKAQDGLAGGKNGLAGHDGEDLILKFPVGSVITNTSSGDEISLDEIGQQNILLRGGRGGLGNEHFKSSTNTTPYESTPGKDGEEAVFDVELRLFADVGLVGLPSAGKSTLLNELTNAHSKAAEYHFTTLEPHLGVLHGTDVIIADIPGLIEGANEGKGLGHKFLRHIQRTKKIVHLISVENEDVVGAYKTIREELMKYDKKLSEKEEYVFLSKIDMVPEELVQQKQQELEEGTGQNVLLVSVLDDELVQDVRTCLV